jgi:hypothetical protein
MVDILDHASRDELVVKYRDLIAAQSIDHEVDFSAIEEVDYVWRGERYADLVGPDRRYDWIIASHLIEHTPDLIGFLTNCEDILSRDGVLVLAVPDKRYCFDRFRPLSGIAQVIDSHLGGDNVHSAGVEAECHLYSVSKGGKAGWGPQHVGEYEWLYSETNVRALIDRARTATEYRDYHRWCFTPSSFRLLVHDLRDLGFISLQEVDFSSLGGEFVVRLGRGESHATVDRIELMCEIDRELAFIRRTNFEKWIAKARKKLKRTLSLVMGGR